MNSTDLIFLIGLYILKVTHASHHRQEFDFGYDGIDRSDRSIKDPLLWSKCENNSVHGKELEFDNIFLNGSIKMDDYQGEVLLLVNVASF